MLSTRKLVGLCLLLPILVAAATLGRPGQQAEETPYWYASYYTVDWRQMDSLRVLGEKYSFPVVEEAKKTGKVLDYKWLIHDTGDERNLVIMIKYRTWSAIREGVFGDASRRVEPDSTKRAAIRRAFSDIFQGAAHRDVIYTEFMPGM